MFKSVLVIILVIGILWISRIVMQRVKQQPPANTTTSKDTVQCIQCSIYIPREEAIIKSNKTFCCEQHMNDWNQSA